MNKRFSIFLLLLVIIALAVAQKPASYLGRAVQEIDNDYLDVITTDLPSAVTFTMVYSRTKCPKCNSMKDIVDRVAKSLHEQVKFTAVDINDPAADKIFSVLNVDPSNPPTLPILRMLTPTSSKDITVTSAKDLKETALSALSKAASVPRLTAASSKSFLSFTKSSLPKILLFAAKKESSPTNQALSLRLTGRADVAEVLKSERKLVRQFDVDEFPSIVLVRPDGDPILYGGVRKLGPILAWAAPHLPSHSPTIPFVDDASCLATHCAAPLGLCAIVTLPADAIHADNTLSGAAAGYLAIAAAAADDVNLSGAQSVSVVYMKDTHPFARWLGISPESYPQLTAFSARKAAGASMVGSFSFEAVRSWLTDLSAGRVATEPLAPIADFTAAGAAVSIAEALAPHGTDSFQALTTLPAFSGASDCTAVIEKRIRQQKAIAASSQPQHQPQHQPQQPTAESKPFEMNNGLPTWSAPARPPAKRGQLLSLHLSERLKASIAGAAELEADEGKVVDELEALFKRNVPVVIHALSDNDSIPAISTDLIDRAAKAANSMVIFVSLPCGDAKALVKNAQCGDLTLLPPPGDVQDIQEIMKIRINNSQIYKTPSPVPSNVDSKVVEWALSVYDSPAASADVSIPVLTSAEQFQPFMMKNLLLPKAILFTDKAKVPYLMKALAHEFLYFADVAVVTVSAATDAVTKQFQVDSTPSMRIINPAIKPQQDGQHAISMEMVPVQKQLIYYNNIGRVLDNIVKNKIPPSQAPKVEMRAPKDEL